jgi:polyisoprenyl-phosphate glycosyltransferase
MAGTDAAARRHRAVVRGLPGAIPTAEIEVTAMTKINERVSTGASRKPMVSVVLSFYNEENVLPELVRRLRDVFIAEQAKGVVSGYELVFVNDNSTDGSLDILLAEARARGDIVVVNMSRNFGVSECVLAGMEYTKGDAVVYMDADLQDPPEVIPELLDRWTKDAAVDVVYTTRLSRAGENRLKMLITGWGYRFINRISDVKFPVDSGDFKLLSRRVVNELLRLKETKPYLKGLVSWLGFKQAQVFYHREARFDGRENSKHPLLSRKVISYHLDRSLISFSDVPLKATLALGFTVSFISGIYILVVIFQKVMGWYVPGWPAIMASVLFLGGVQLTVLGVIGLYINTIYLEAKGRPNYIVKDVIAGDERDFNGEHPAADGFESRNERPTRIHSGTWQ